MCKILNTSNVHCLNKTTDIKNNNIHGEGKKKENPIFRQGQSIATHPLSALYFFNVFLIVFFYYSKPLLGSMTLQGMKTRKTREIIA